MKLDLQVDQTFATHADEVWRALSDPAVLGRWLMPNDLEARVGHRFGLSGPSTPRGAGLTECRVLEVDPPRRMVWSWNGGAPDEVETRVVFDVTPEQDGRAARLRVCHVGDAMPAQRQALRGLWTRRIEFLRDVVGPGYAIRVDLATRRELVFDAVATVDGLRCWCAVDGHAPANGGDVRVELGEAGELVDVRVERARRPSSVQWSCTVRVGDRVWERSVVTFELGDLGPRLSELRVRQAEVPCEAVAQGWDGALERLVGYVEGVERPGLRDAARP